MEFAMMNSLFRREIYKAEDGYTMPYRLYIPKDYDCGEQYPLVLFLHGSGERGDDNEAQITVGLPSFFRWEKVQKSIIVAPQCPNNHQWVDIYHYTGVYSVKECPESRESKAVLEILTRVMNFCNVDPDRVYITGLSLGGFGTFDLLTRHGSWFAAGVPICGGWDPAAVNLLTRIPIWAFHGSMDTAVPPKGSRLAFAAIRQAGGEQCRYTEYTGMGHGIWTNAYSDEEMVDWLFAQSRTKRRLLAEKRARQKKKAALVAGGVGVLAVAAAIITGKVIKKEQRKQAAMPAEAAVPSPAPAAPASANAIQENREIRQPKAIKPVKKIKPIKKVKSSKGKVILEKAMDRTADMTVKVIKRLAK